MPVGAWRQFRFYFVPSLLFYFTERYALAATGGPDDDIADTYRRVSPI